MSSTATASKDVLSDLLAKQMERIQQNTDNWQERMAALTEMKSIFEKLEQLVPPGGTISADVWRLLKPLKLIVTDLRSQLVKEVCALLGTMSKATRDAMVNFLREILPPLVEVCGSGNKVCAAYCSECIEVIVCHTLVKGANLRFFVDTLVESKSKSIRLVCICSLKHCVSYWSCFLDKYDVLLLEKGLRNALQDASSHCRNESTLFFSVYQQNFPKRAAAFVSMMDYKVQKRLESLAVSSVKPSTRSPSFSRSSMSGTAIAVAADQSTLSSSSSQPLPPAEGDSEGDNSGLAVGQQSPPPPLHPNSTRWSMSELELDSRLLAAASSSNPPSPHDATPPPQEDSSNMSVDLSLTNLTLNEEDRDGGFTLGSRVVIPDREMFGFVRYVGKIENVKGTWIGVELDEPFGKNDGSVKGKYYFRCAPRHGLFAKAHQVVLLPKKDLNGSTANAEELQVADLEKQLNGVALDEEEFQKDSLAPLHVVLVQAARTHRDYLDKLLEAVHKELEEHERFASFAATACSADVVNYLQQIQNAAQEKIVFSDAFIQQMIQFQQVARES